MAFKMPQGLGFGIKLVSKNVKTNPQGQGTAPCILIKKGMIMIYYVENLITFAEKTSLIGGLRTELGKKIKAKI